MIAEKDIIDGHVNNNTVEESSSTAVQFELNYFSFFYISLLILGLTSWLVVAIWYLLVGSSGFKLMAPINPVIVVPFLMILFLPPIISLTVILLRSLYTRYSKSHFYLAPLDLSANENQRQIFLLPLSVCGLTMAVLPAYYIRFEEHLMMLAGLGGLGLLCLALFLAIALTPEKGKGGNLLMPIVNKNA